MIRWDDYEAEAVGQRVAAEIRRHESDLEMRRRLPEMPPEMPTRTHMLVGFRGYRAPRPPHGRLSPSAVETVAYWVRHDYRTMRAHGVPRGTARKIALRHVHCASVAAINPRHENAGHPERE